MSWRTILLLALLIVLLASHCGGEVKDSKDIRIWTTPDEPAGVPFDVFCNHEEHCRVELTRYNFITRKFEVLLTERVNNNNTVKHSVKQSPGNLEVLEFRCHNLNKSTWDTKILRGPLPNISDFECRWEKNRNQKNSDALECTFGQLGEEIYWNFIRYYLVINDSNRTFECERSPQNKSQIQCNCNGFSSSCRIKNSEHIIPYNFKVLVRYDGRVQMQEFNLTRVQIEVPKWTFSVVGIEFRNELGQLHILQFDDNMEKDFRKFQWRVVLKPLNPRHKEWEAKVHLSEFIVWYIRFEYPPYGNQNYEMRLWRRFNNPDSPWTRSFIAFPFVTWPTVPNRPPQLLPNGFYHDPEKGELSVYWKHLDELEFGSTNFKYAVDTDNGQHVLTVSRYYTLMRNWNTTKPSTVTIWSENIEGRSANISWFEVPLLTSANCRQPRDVWYHIDNNTVTWEPPIDMDKLIGYTFYWCLISISSGTCYDLKFIELSISQEHFHFNKSITLYRTAVAAKYKKNISGGMIWSRPMPIWITNKESKSISYLVMTVIILGTLGLFFLFLNIFRKTRAMSDIIVELPDGLFGLLQEPTDTELTNCADLNPSQNPIVENISPEVPVQKSTEKNSEPYVSTEDPKSDDTNIDSKPDINLLTSSVPDTSTAFAKSLQDPPVASTHTPIPCEFRAKANIEYVDVDVHKE